jgi:hypothetical protein
MWPSPELLLPAFTWQGEARFAMRTRSAPESARIVD